MSQVIAFPFFPLARKRQIEALLTNPTLSLREIYYLRAQLGWCENLLLQEHQKAREGRDG